MVQESLNYDFKRTERPESLWFNVTIKLQKAMIYKLNMTGAALFQLISLKAEM